MELDRRARRDAFLEQALDLEGEARETFLAHACGDDRELRIEIDRLIAYDRDERAAFLDRGATPASKRGGSATTYSAVGSDPFAFVGRSVAGRFSVLEFLGDGGMGEVFKARDEQLGRLVALKFLRTDVAPNAGQREHLSLEARALCALAHPNICTLYDLGWDGERPFLVMEYLSGETLARRLARGPLTCPELAPIARALIDALSHAHQAGIVHRDLKPGNVMLTPAGVKLFDFGIAKRLLVSDDGGDTRSTRFSTIVGSASYMSPEQSEGRHVDARSDIFSLGCVLYEALTGQAAFVGDSFQSTLAAIRTHDPRPVHEAAPATPPRLSEVVSRCLEKDPAQRFQDGDALSRALGPVFEALAPTVGLVRPRSRWRRALLVTATAAAAAAAVVAWRSASSSLPPPRDMSFRQVTFVGDVQVAALAADNRTLAYARGVPMQDMGVFVQDVEGGRALEIWRGRNVGSLTWLPDASQVVISGTEKTEARTVTSRVWLIPRLGGVPRRVVELDSSYTVAVSADGRWLAGSSQYGPVVQVTPVGGGPKRQIRIPIATELAALGELAWHPNGNRLVVYAYDPDGGMTLWAVTPDSGTALEVFRWRDPRVSFCWAPLADALYIQRPTEATFELVRVAFDLNGKPGGPELLLGGLPVASGCQVSPDGKRILQIRANQVANLWRVDASTSGAAPVALTTGTSFYGVPRISPDERWMAASLGIGVQRLAKLSVEGGEPTIVPGPIGATGVGAVWSPDGQRLAFASDRGAGTGVWVSDTSGQQAQAIERSSPGSPMVEWLPDGRLAWPDASNRNYHIRDLASGREDLMLRQPATNEWVFQPRFSPSGDSVAFLWNRDGAHGLWTMSWPGRELHLLVRDHLPIGWSADRQSLFAYRFEGREIVKIALATGRLQTVAQFPVGRLSGFTCCDVAKSGRFIACQLTETVGDAWLIGHFDPHVPE